MTKNVTTNVIAAIAILLLAACASPKNVAYIQNTEQRRICCRQLGISL